MRRRHAARNLRESLPAVCCVCSAVRRYKTVPHRLRTGWAGSPLDPRLYGFPRWSPSRWYSMHYYEGGADRPTDFTAAHSDEQLSIFTKVEDALIEQRTLLDGYREGRKIGLILDEWGVWDKIPPEDETRYGKLWQQSTMRSAVAAGLGLNIFNRQADKLYMCNIAQIVNVLQSLLLTDGPEGSNCIRTTTYYAFQLFKPHRGKTAIRVENTDSSPLAPSVSAS